MLAELIRICILFSLTGISRKQIGLWIDRKPVPTYKARFTNKPDLRPITAKQPMNRIQADLVDLGLDLQRDGTRYVLVLLDVFSRYLWLKPLKQKKPVEVVKHLESVFTEFGFPMVFQTDNGSEFRGELVNYCKENNIKKIFSSPNHPQSQGKV